jgi:hypothetical protein
MYLAATLVHRLHEDVPLTHTHTHTHTHARTHARTHAHTHTHTNTRYRPESDLGLRPDHPDYASYLNWIAHADATLTFPQTVVLRCVRSSHTHTHTHTHTHKPTLKTICIGC